MAQSIESLMDHLVLCNRLEVRYLIQYRKIELSKIRTKKVQYKRKLRVALGLQDKSRKQAFESLFNRFGD